MVQKNLLGPQANPVPCLCGLQIATNFNRKATVRDTANIATASWDVALLSLGMAWKLVSAVGGQELLPLVTACMEVLMSASLQAFPMWHELNGLRRWAE